MPYIKANAPTWLKARPIDSKLLAKADKFQVPKGQSLGILDCYDDASGHVRVIMAGHVTAHGRKWADAYIFGGHWDGLASATKQRVAKDLPFSRPGSARVVQPAPYFIQNDNHDWADDGSASSLRYGAVQCGITSMAIALATVWPNDKVAQKAAEGKDGQFENWLAGVFKQLGRASTSAADHVAVFEHLGIKSRFTMTSTVGELKEALERHPVILGTAYKGSGHFICAVGFDRATGSVLVHDPYGQRQLNGSFNNWVNICQSKGDTFGRANEYSPDVLNSIWVDGGHASGWAVYMDPSTPNYGNGSEPIAIPAKTFDSGQTAPDPAAPAAVDVGSGIPLDKIVAAIKATGNPQLPPDEILVLAKAIEDAADDYEISSPLRMAHLLSQVAHESGGYWWLEEIASGSDYEGREDLGNTLPGDGVRFKGRGLIQLTGRANYKGFMDATSIDVMGDPKQLAVYPGALLSALYFWRREKLNEVADEGASEAVVTKLTKIINGGTNGLDDRMAKFAKLRDILK